MKPTKTQIPLAYIASISLMLMVFHRRIGLPDYWEWIFGVIWLLGLVAFFLSRRRQKIALSATGAIPSKPSRPNKTNTPPSRDFIFVTLLSSFSAPLHGCRCLTHPADYDFDQHVYFICHGLFDRMEA